MAIHDPISDMLTIIRNARRNKKPFCTVRNSNVNRAILATLKKHGYLYDFRSVEDGAQGAVRVYLEVPSNIKDIKIRGIREIKRVSRPGLRVYTTAEDMPRILNGLGACVVSTSKGVMSGGEARKQRIGGEVLVKVW